MWSRAGVVVKVKEPEQPEFARMREGQILFTYLHWPRCPNSPAVLLERVLLGSVPGVPPAEVIISAAGSWA